MKIRHLPLLMCLLLPIGCQPVTANTPPAALAPGYLNAADQQMSEILHAAHAYYQHLYNDGSATPPIYNPSPAEKAAFNQFGVYLNLADATYKAFHAGTATQAQAQAAVDTVKSQQAAVQAFPGVK